METFLFITAGGMPPALYFLMRPLITVEGCKEFIRRSWWLHPNWICAWRTLIAWVGLCLYFLLHPLIGILFFSTGAIGDALDGFIARTCGLETDLGEKLDPLCDKLTYIPALLGFSFAGILNLYLVIVLAFIDLMGQFVARPLLERIGLSVKANKWGKAKTTICFILVVYCAFILLHALSASTFISIANSILLICIGLAICSIVFKINIHKVAS